jgi:ribonuclease R
LKIKELITKYFKKQQPGFVIDRVRLASILEIEKDQYQLFFQALNSLEKERTLQRNIDGTYTMFDRKKYSEGIIRTHAKGFAFVTIDGELEDLFVKASDVNGALDGDRVCVQKIRDHQEPEKFAAIVIEVVERANHRQVGEVEAFNTKYFRVKTDDVSYHGDIFIVKKAAPQVVVGHKVVVKPTNHLVTGKILGEVEEILGHANDPGIDILSIVKQNNIETVFDDAVFTELAQVPAIVSVSEVANRQDIRDRLTITIDGADAKDLDDAISLKKLANGNYLLGVHIADVSHYVKTGSSIDINAQRRGTSVYLADRVIPMLPHQLSNGICSLNPQVDRLALSCDMEIDNSGKVIANEIYESVIYSDERMTYTAVNQMLAGDAEIIEQYQHIYSMVKDMATLASILDHKRHNRGALNFEIDEAKIIVDEAGKPTDIVVRERGVGERLIEQFMLEANETVAREFTQKALPFIYRVHGLPQDTKLDVFRQVARNMGVDVGSLKDATSLNPKTLQVLLANIQEKSDHSLLSSLLLRAMQKAEYNPHNIGHFGLAATNYTHFTSPIRRYPDLMVHRLIRHLLLEQPQFTSNGNVLTEELNIIAHDSSVAERRAIDCERAVTNMKMAEYMEEHIGEKFTGIISGVTNSGFFVELPNLIEGRVAIETLVDDYYVHIPEKIMLLGRRTNKQFRMGSQVDVSVVAASKARSEITFEVEGIVADSHSKGTFNSNKAGGYHRKRLTEKNKGNYSNNKSNRDGYKGRKNSNENNKKKAKETGNHSKAWSNSNKNDKRGPKTNTRGRGGKRK